MKNSRMDSVGTDTTRDLIPGLIVEALGGFYYVQQEKGPPVACRARGLFRRQGVSPLAGDTVLVRSTEEGTGYIEEILPRTNSLTRPPVANLDILVLVASLCSPPPNLLVLDKLAAIAEHQSIEPLLAVTKTDLDSQAGARELCALYQSAGIPVYAVSALTGEGTKELRAALAGKISCFCGNTGAGKSSLLNAIDPRLSLETGEISEKLGRGRHTTRHIHLFKLDEGGYIADTPGFSAVDLTRYERIRKEELERCFREFAHYLGQCRYVGCSHTCEAGCAVLAALERGELARSRWESYKTMYEDARQIKEWEYSGK